MSADSEPRYDALDDNRLVSGGNGDVLLDCRPLPVPLTASCVRVQVRPKVEFHSLLQHAGATKDVFTMKEVGSPNLQSEHSVWTSSFSLNLQTSNLDLQPEQLFSTCR